MPNQTIVPLSDAADRPASTASIARVLGRTLLCRCPHCGSDLAAQGKLAHVRECERCPAPLVTRGSDFVAVAVVFSTAAAALLSSILVVAALIGFGVVPATAALEFAVPSLTPLLLTLLFSGAVASEERRAP